MNVDPVNITYTPSGPVSKAFLESSSFVRGIMGPLGSGKSVACTMEILLRSAEQKPGDYPKLLS